MQFIRERRKDLFGKSSSEQIALLKTYIYNSMNRKIQAINSKSSDNNIDSKYFGGRMNFDYMKVKHSVEKHFAACLESLIIFGAAANIVKLLNEHNILISNSMKSNISIPDSAEIGYVRNIII